MVDRDWFGMPMSIRGAIWLLLPGALPDGEDPWERLEASDRKGEKARVRIAHLIHAMAADAKGDIDRVRAVIKRHADHIERRKPNAKYRMLDAMATEGLMRISDRMWTEAMGYRTPIGGLGTFWDENASDDIEEIDMDDLF